MYVRIEQIGVVIAGIFATIMASLIIVSMFI